MTVTVAIKNNKNKKQIKPKKMFDRKYYYGTVFQEYFNNKPEKTFWVKLDPAGESLLNVWFNEENNKYELSTDNIESLLEFAESVKVVKIEADINFSLDFSGAKND